MSNSKIRRIPAYTLHKGRNQARVRIDGRDYYLGAYGSPESHEAYDNLIAEFIESPAVDHRRISVSELLVLWWTHCKERYGRHGKGQYGNAVCWRPAIRLLRVHHGDEKPRQFGPRAFRELINRMREMGWSRPYAAENVTRIKTIFKWGVSMEYVANDVFQRLDTVEAPKRGECFPEPPPVEPVADAIVEATLPFMSEKVADMVRFQRFTGCRPGEVVTVKPGELDRTDEVWRYVPGHHKTAHRGKKRVIAIGPRAQAVITKYLLREEDAYCFPSRRAQCYTTDSYRRAIQRACERRARADEKELESWSPNQLRHAAAGDVTDAFDIEHASAMLGHSSPEVTMIYAARLSRNEQKAAEVAKRLG